MPLESTRLCFPFRSGGTGGIDARTAQIAPIAPGTQAMGGRNTLLVRATGGCASKTGSSNKAEKAAVVRGKSSTPGLCA